MGALADVLVARGGYNPVDAANAETGPRAAELAREFGVGTGSAGGGRTAESIDLSQVPSVTGFVQSQFAAEDPALRDLVMAMRAREQPLDIYGRLETEAGLPELRRTSTSLSKEIASIEDYLEQIEPDVTARTRESIVTEAQRRGMVAAGREPFLQKLGKFATSLGRISGRISQAEQGIATKTELAMRGQEMGLEPYKLRFQVMVDRNARLLTGFTADRQTQLDVLFDKLNRTRQLSDQEWALANTLAQEERGYSRQLQTAAAQLGAKITGGESTDALLKLISDASAAQIAFDRNIKLKELAKSGADKKTTVNTVLSNVNDLLDYSTNAQWDASSYIWKLQNSQPGLFSSAEWDQLWGFVNSLPATGKPSSSAAQTSGMTLNPDGSISFK